VKNFPLKNFSAGFFSNKKIFTVEASVNCRNKRGLAHDPDDVPVGSRIRFLSSICILGVVSNERDVMSPYFFKKDETVTKEGYFDILQEKLMSWIKKVTVGASHEFQQDGKSAHNSH
jgi:hypothetical protein